MGEYHRTDVAAIHYDTTATSHLLLLGNHSLTDKAEGSYRADMAGYFHGTDVALHEFAIEIGVGTTCLGIEFKRDVNIVHTGTQTSLVDAAISCKQSVAQGEKGDAAIHGASIYINIAHLTGQVFGHRALSTRGMTVNCNCYFLHSV